MSINAIFTRPSLGVHIKDNLFVFNGVNLSNVVVVESITRTLAPSSEVRTANIPGRDGQRFLGSSYGIRTINLRIRIVEATFADALDTQLYLANILSTREPKRLELRDFAQKELYNLSILSSEVALDRVLDTLEGELTFTCYSPFNYSLTPVTAVLLIGTNVPVNNNGIATSDIKLTLTFNTAVPVYGVITITDDSGGRITFKGPFSIGNVAIYEDYTFRINGNLMNNRIDISDSTFINLKNGINNLNVVAESGALDCEIMFTEVYL